MLERKRASKHYNLVPGEEDLELGEGSGSTHLDEDNEGGQENGILPAPTTLEQEVDNWDENAEDWDEDGDEPTTTEGDEPVTPNNEEEAVLHDDAKKRAD